MSVPQPGRTAVVAGLAVGSLVLSACSAGSLGSSNTAPSGSPAAATNGAGRQHRHDRQDAAGCDRGLQRQEDRRHGQAGDPGPGHRRRQRRQDPARHRRHDRAVPVQLGFADGRRWTRPGTWCRSPASPTWPTSRMPSRSVTSDGQVYGVPLGQATGGGVLYNKKVYADLGLAVPKTWDEFMANNAKIKAAGIDPVIQSYGDTWTSQLFVLADFANVDRGAAGMGGQVHGQRGQVRQGAGHQGLPASRGGEQGRLPEQGLRLVEVRQGPAQPGQGKGAQYPMLTFVHRHLWPHWPTRPPRTSASSPCRVTMPPTYGTTDWRPVRCTFRPPPPAPSWMRPRSSSPSSPPRRPATCRPGRRPDRPVHGQGLHAARPAAGRGQGPADLLGRRQTSFRRWSSSLRSRVRTWRRSPSRSAPASPGRRWRQALRRGRQEAGPAVGPRGW